MPHKLAQNQRTLVSLVLSFFVALSFPLTALSDGLGISVSIIPYQDDSGLSSGNDRLWFPIEPGESFQRDIRVTSQTDLRQVVSLQIFDTVLENGRRVTNLSQPSLISDWAGDIASKSYVLEPGESIVIPIEFSVPNDAIQRAYEGNVRVLASELTDGEGPESSGAVQAIVQGAVAIDLAFWVGVGDVLALLPEFNIVKIEGVLLDDTKYLRVYFENTGLSPLRLQGSIQFADPQFLERVYDPVTYLAPEISSGEVGFADVLIDQEIIEGNWNVFVVAEQDGIRQTRLFEGRLRFLAPGSLPAWVGLALQIALGLLSLAGAFVGLRAIRTSRNKTDELEPSEPKPIQKERFKLPKITLQIPKLDLTGLINPIRALGDTLKTKIKERAEKPKPEKPAAVFQKSVRPKVQKPERPKAHKATKAEKSFEGRVQALMSANQTVRELMGDDIKEAVFQAEMAEKYPQGNYKFDITTLDSSSQTRVRQILDAKRTIRELQTDELRIEVIRRETDAKLERMRQGSRA